MGGYEYLAADSERPKRIADHTNAWERLTPLSGVNGTVRERVENFARRKRIRVEALEALGTRIAHRRGGGVQLAFAGENGAGTVTAIKYRPLDGSSHDSTAEAPSTWLRPIIVGRRDSLDWLVVEGETDGARVYDLAGDHAAVLVLPAGALTFRREWAALIPRGASVALLHDADHDGDRGAEKAQQIIGGKTLRVRPPVEGGDWCDWEGDREAFLELLGAARGPSAVFSPLTDFLVHPFPKAEPLLGKRPKIYVARGSLLMTYGPDGASKTTVGIDAMAHMAAGIDWLGISVERPVRFCVIENEGPPDLFQQKLAAKVTTWNGLSFAGNVFVYRSPWGEFTFADPAMRAELVAFCEEHGVDVVTANPTLGLGVAASGRPDETQQFVDWLVECGLKSERAFWLNHHENKAGQISGDWGRHPDTKLLLQKDGNRQRTKLTWDKTRWATLDEDEKSYMLEWIVETEGYDVVPLDSASVSDYELDERLEAYLAEHPLSSTKTVLAAVTGADDRLSKRLKTSTKFDSVKRGNAVLWFLAGEDVAPGETQRSQP